MLKHTLFLHSLNNFIFSNIVFMYFSIVLILHISISTKLNKINKYEI